MSALRDWWSGKQKCPHQATLAKDCLLCLKRLAAAAERKAIKKAIKKANRP